MAWRVRALAPHLAPGTGGAKADRRGAGDRGRGDDRYRAVSQVGQGGHDGNEDDCRLNTRISRYKIHMAGSPMVISWDLPGIAPSRRI
jgi:hypothetical protein